jgi:hypothetical protein
MSGPDEFDDFVARRKPLFPRPPDGIEPPAELDRLVLRQAREAIRSETSEPAYHGTRWGMPVAIAASVLVAATIVLHIGLTQREPVPQVTVQNITQRTEQAATPAPTATPAPAETTASTSAAATPDWRRDTRSWLARIERLRAEGKTAEADAEMAEYRKANRAYAGSPDR